MKRVRETLTAIDGIHQVNIDFETKQATCKVNSETFDSQQALSQLAEAGYEESTVQEETN